jgi:hypothetical protein
MGFRREDGIDIGHIDGRLPGDLGEIGVDGVPLEVEWCFEIGARRRGVRARSGWTADIIRRIDCKTGIEVN